MAGLISGGAALFCVVLYALIAARLRKVHPQVWEKLARPAALHDSTQYGSLLLSDYIWKAKWLDLRDPIATALCVAFYISAAVLAFSFVLTIIPTTNS